MPQYSSSLRDAIVGLLNKPEAPSGDPELIDVARAQKEAEIKARQGWGAKAIDWMSDAVGGFTGLPMGESGRTRTFWEMVNAGLPLAGALGAVVKLPRRLNTPAFKNWFGESAAVDEAGIPKVLYHGTTRQNVRTIRPSKGIEAPGAAFLTDNEDVASTFTVPREYGEPVYEDEWGRAIKPGKVVPVYARLQKPMVISGAEAQRVSDDTAHQVQTIRRAKAEGYDGIILRGVKEGIGEQYLGDTYVIFEPTQVKAARGNKTWNPDDPDIYKE